MLAQQGLAAQNQEGASPFRRLPIGGGSDPMSFVNPVSRASRRGGPLSLVPSFITRPSSLALDAR